MKVSELALESTRLVTVELASVKGVSLLEAKVEAVNLSLMLNCRVSLVWNGTVLTVDPERLLGCFE